MTPAGIGPLALTDLPDPCILGSGDDVAAYGLAARLLTPPDAPAEWGEPSPVSCLDLRAFIGSRFDRAGLADLERACNAALRQDERADSASASIVLDGGKLACTVRGVGAEGPFSFVLTVDEVSAAILWAA